MTELIRSVLASLGCRSLEVAATVDEGWELLETCVFDLLIVDRNFQGADGLELVRRIRRPGGSPAAFLPILMLTGSAERSVVSAARDAGVSEYLVKPFTVSSLVDRLNALIHRPRSFIHAERYFGPDRRRREDPAYQGLDRRRR